MLRSFASRSLKYFNIRRCKFRFKKRTSISEKKVRCKMKDVLKKFGLWKAVRNAQRTLSRRKIVRRCSRYFPYRSCLLPMYQNLRWYNVSFMRRKIADFIPCLSEDAKSFISQFLLFRHQRQFFMIPFTATISWLNYFNFTSRQRIVVCSIKRSGASSTERPQLVKFVPLNDCNL